MRVLAVPVILALMLVLAALWARVVLELRLQWYQSRFAVGFVMHVPVRRLRIVVARFVWRFRMTDERPVPEQLLLTIVRRLVPRWLGRAVGPIVSIGRRLLQRRIHSRSAGLRLPLREPLSMLRRLSLERLRLDVSVGTGDASSTALAVGRWWATAGTLTAALAGAGFPVDRLHVRIRPRFHHRIRRGRIICIFTGSVADIIVAAWRIMRRGGQARERTPDRGSDEDGDGKHQRDGGRDHSRRRRG